MDNHQKIIHLNPLTWLIGIMRLKEKKKKKEELPKLTDQFNKSSRDRLRTVIPI